MSSRAEDIAKEINRRIAMGASELEGSPKVASGPPRHREKEMPAAKRVMEEKLAAIRNGNARMLSEKDLDHTSDFEFARMKSGAVPNTPVNPPGYKVVVGLDPEEVLAKEAAAKQAKQAKVAAQQGGGGGGGQKQQQPQQAAPPPAPPPVQPQTTAPPPMAQPMGPPMNRPAPTPPGSLNLSQFDPATRFGGDKGPGPLSQLQQQQGVINQRQNAIDMTLQQISEMISGFQQAQQQLQQQLQQVAQGGQATAQQQAQIMQMMQQMGGGQEAPPEQAPGGGAPGMPPQSASPQAAPAQAAPPPGAQQGQPPPAPMVSRTPQEGIQTDAEVPMAGSAPGGTDYQQQGAQPPAPQGSAPGAQDGQVFNAPEGHPMHAGVDWAEGQDQVPSETLEEKTELHPLAVKDSMDQALGPDWVQWVPETVDQMVQRVIGGELDREVMDMIQAIQVVATNKAFWTDWRAFNYITAAFNGVSPGGTDFESVEPVSPGQMVFAVLTALQISKQHQEFSDDVKGYIAVMLHEAGYPYAPPPLDSVQPVLDQMHQGTAIPDPQAVEGRFVQLIQVPIDQAGLDLEGRNPVDEAVVKLLAMRDYIAIKKSEYEKSKTQAQ